MQLTSSITNLIQTLCKVVEEVIMVVDYNTQFTELQDLAGSFEERPSDVSIPIPPIKTQVLGEATDLGTIELNTMLKNLGHVTINFFARSVCHSEICNHKNEGQRGCIGQPSSRIKQDCS